MSGFGGWVGAFRDIGRMTSYARGIVHNADYVIVGTARDVGHAAGFGNVVSGGYKQTVRYDGANGAAANRAQLAEGITGEQLNDFRAWQAARHAAAAGQPVQVAQAGPVAQPQPQSQPQPGAPVPLHGGGQPSPQQPVTQEALIPAGSGEDAHNYNAPRMPQHLKQNQVKALQELLARGGFNPGAADEKWGPKSETAFEAAAAKAGFPDPTKFDFANPDHVRKLQGALVVSQGQGTGAPVQTAWGAAPVAGQQVVGAYTNSNFAEGHFVESPRVSDARPKQFVAERDSGGSRA